MAIEGFEVARQLQRISELIVSKTVSLIESFAAGSVLVAPLHERVLEQPEYLVEREPDQRHDDGDADNGRGKER